jgi:hypothetical protein
VCGHSVVRTAPLWATAGRRAVHRILYIALYLLTDSAMLLATVAAGLYEY